MAFPYKKMDEADIAFIRSVASPDRVAVGEEIASEYYHDEIYPRGGPQMIRLYKSEKLAFDENLILNPGKIIEFNE